MSLPTTGLKQPITIDQTKVKGIKGYDLNGSNQYLSIADASQTGLDLSSDFTLEFDLKCDDFTPAYSFVMGKYNTTTNQRAYGLYLQNSGGYKLYLSTSDNGTASSNTISAALDLVEGKTYTIRVEYDLSAGTAEFFVDGVSQGTASGGKTSLHNSTADFTVGMASNGTDRPLDGVISNVKVYSDITQTTLVLDCPLQDDANDDSGNGNHLTLTGAPSIVDERVDDYVAYIDLADLDKTGAGEEDIFDYATTSGGDIRVSEADGVTELAREVVSFDKTNKTGELHVKLLDPLATDTDTTIYIWVDGTSSDYAVTDTYGRNAVWSDYALTWHAESLDDSTGNNTLTGQGGITAGGVSGQLGAGTDFDGTDDYITMPTTTGLSQAGDVYITVWVEPNPETTNRYVYSTHSGSPFSGFALGITTDEKIRFYDGTAWRVGTQTLLAGLNKVTVRVSGTEHKYYLNGVLGDTNTYSAPVSDTQTKAIGARADGAMPCDSVLDELRVRRGVTNMNEDWEATEYNNQSSPSTFYSVGVGELLGSASSDNAIMMGANF